MHRFFSVVLLLPLIISSCASGGEVLCGMIDGYPIKYWELTKYTEMTLINDAPAEIKNDGYVAVAALDTSDTPHILITPIIKDDGCSESNSLENMNYDGERSTSFTMEKAETLSDTLSGIVTHLQSDKPLPISDTTKIGTIKLANVPERTSFIKQEKETTSNISPTKILYLNPVQTIITYDKNGMRGGAVKLENAYQTLADFDSLKALKRFNDVLEKGVQKMEVMAEG